MTDAALAALRHPASTPPSKNPRLTPPQSANYTLWRRFYLYAHTRD